MPVVNRRDMLRALSMAVPSFALGESAKPLRISLAEWSVHRAIMGLKMTNLDFPRYARELGIEGLEFVNGLWGCLLYTSSSGSSTGGRNDHGRATMNKVHAA